MISMNYKKALFVAIFITLFTFTSVNISIAQNVRSLPDVIPPTKADSKKLEMMPFVPMQPLNPTSDNSSMNKLLNPSKTPAKTKIKLSKIEQIFNNIYIQRLKALDASLRIDFDKAENLNTANNLKKMDIERLLNASDEKEDSSNESANFSNITNVTGAKITPEEITRINKEYIDSGNILYQYGYDIFEKRIINSSPELNTNKLLAPGDSVLFNMWGDAVDILLASNSDFKPSAALSVDKDGFINIPGMGNIFAAGLTVEQARTALENLFNQRYIGVNVDLKLQQAGSVPVYVLGEVENPGVKMVPASGGVIEALSLSGGIKKSGSLRNIMLTNKTKSKKVNIDLYEFIREGITYSKPIERGSVIIVPPIGKVAALNGAVLTSAIYEFKTGETLESMLNMAGGLLPSVNKNFILIESFNLNDNNKIMSEVNSSAIKFIKLKSGDLITFYESSEEIDNGITLLGNVKNPRNIQINEDTTLSDILKSKNDLLARTDENIVEIERETGIGKNPKVFNLSLKEVIEGNADLKLEPRDKVRIFNEVITPEIKVSGAVNNPGIFPVEPEMKITDIIGKVGLLYPAENMVVELTRNDGAIETIYLYDLLTLNDTSRNSTVKSGDYIFFRKLKDAERMRTVTMLGYVGKPGVYKFQENMKFIDALSEAGGLREKAYLKGLIFIRKSILKDESQILEKLIKRVESDALQSSMKLAVSGDSKDAQSVKAIYAAQKELVENLRSRSSELYGRLVLDPTKNFVETLNHIDMRDGDVIYVPEKTDYVLVTGEVYNQSALLFDENKSVKQYINDVGGFTKKAAKKLAYISKVNGTILAYRQNKGKFLTAKLDPGDAIVIPSKTNPPINVMNMVKDVTDIISKAATTVFILNQLKK